MNTTWWLPGQLIEKACRGRIYSTLEAIPSVDTAIVLGARVFSDGRPSNALAARLTQARALYVSGQVKRLLISGNGLPPKLDEIRVMHAWLRDRDVPQEAIVSDPRGIRTRETMRRAAEQFHVRSAVICTNSFHLPRAIYLARHFGIDAVGSTEEPLGYVPNPKTQLREKGARLRAIVECWFKLPRD